MLGINRFSRHQLNAISGTGWPREPRTMGSK
jgi:hypothetical protein